MRKILLAACAVLALGGCGQRIKYGEAAVQINEIGSGVQEQELTTGRFWAPPLSYRYIVKFPTTQQTYNFNNPGFTFINADRVSTTQALSLVVRIEPGKADDLVRKYRGAITKDGGEDGYVLDEIIAGPVAREIQQVLIYRGNEFTSDALYKDGGRTLLQAVNAVVGPKFTKEGIVIEQIMPMSPPVLPTEIVASITGAMKARTEATRKDAELAATIAEGKKRIADAEADARARELTAASIRANPEILRYEEIKRRQGSICPVGVTTCVVGGQALVNAQ